MNTRPARKYLNSDDLAGPKDALLAEVRSKFGLVLLIGASVSAESGIGCFVNLRIHGEATADQRKEIERITERCNFIVNIVEAGQAPQLFFGGRLYSKSSPGPAN